MNPALDTLKNLDLHDQGIDGLQFDLSSKRIVITISIYNDKKSDYDTLELIFVGVGKIAMTELDLADLSNLEIFSYEVVEAFDTHVIKFLLLTGPRNPSVELSFSFNDYQIRSAGGSFK